MTLLAHPPGVVAGPGRPVRLAEKRETVLLLLLRVLLSPAPEAAMVEETLQLLRVAGVLDLLAAQCQRKMGTRTLVAVGAVVLVVVATEARRVMVVLVWLSSNTPQPQHSTSEQDSPQQPQHPATLKSQNLLPVQIQ
jgi:hypothetical protein